MRFLYLVVEYLANFMKWVENVVHFNEAKTVVFQSRFCQVEFVFLHLPTGHMEVTDFSVNK